MLQAAGDAIYWSESRPEEQGRQVIVRAGPDGVREDLLPAPYSARSRVHEYGGGEFLVAGGTVYFINDKDQQVHALARGKPPQRLTHAADTRFADLVHDPARNRLVGVAETHAPRKGAGHALPRNALVAIALGDGVRGRVTELASGRDFYASARVPPDGARLAFLAWDLPDMPWDSASLYVAVLRADGSLGRPRRIAGGKGSAVFQPEWGPDGHLYFAWDESGWGCLYRWDGKRMPRVDRAPRAELWRSQWVFGMRCFALSPGGAFTAVYFDRGLPLLRQGPAQYRQTRGLPCAEKRGRSHRRSNSCRWRLRGPCQSTPGDARSHARRARAPSPPGCEVACGD
jgi:hypothetical protein